MLHTLMAEATDPAAGGAGAPAAAATAAAAAPAPSAPSAPSDTDMKGATVPYGRFSEVVTERNSHRARSEELVQTLSMRDARIAELESQLAGHTEQVEAWNQERSQFEAALEGIRSEFSERWELSEQLGIKDADVIEHGRRKFAEMPEEGRPESLVDAFKAWRENPENCPALLRPHLTAQQTVPSQPARPQAPQRRWPDPKQQTAPPPAPTPPAQQQWTADQYREARKRGWSAADIMRARVSQG